MANEEIKRTAKDHKVFLWEVAEGLGIAESTFCKRLRKELPKSEKDNVMVVIHQIAAARKEEKA